MKIEDRSLTEFNPSLITHNLLNSTSTDLAATTIHGKRNHEKEEPLLPASIAIQDLDISQHVIL